MSALWPVQTAVYARLTSDAALTARATGGVHDGEAPQGAAMPYIVIGEATETRADVFGRRGWSDTLTIHIWSRYPGRMEVLDTLQLIDAALREPLTLTGHTAARLKREFGEVIYDPDGARHVPARYRITTWETTTP